MFENEVLISEADKAKLMYYIGKVNEILDKYPYDSCYAYTVSAMSRAKGAASKAKKWIGYLYTTNNT